MLVMCIQADLNKKMAVHIALITNLVSSFHLSQDPPNLPARFEAKKSNLGKNYIRISQAFVHFKTEQYLSCPHEYMHLT